MKTGAKSADGLSLLEAEAARRKARDEAERLQTRRRLEEGLEKIAGLGATWIYGSIVKPGKFGRYSDVDVAFESLPRGVSLYLLQSLLSEAVGREVDVCLLSETRLREKIVREGERFVAKGE